MDAPSSDTLDPRMSLGLVSLTVSDVARSLEFYQEALGLQVQRRQEGAIYLGAGAQELVALSETPDAVKAARTTGLYHFALLVPSRLALAYAMQRLAARGAAITGGADHGVSEAIYLDDPDGNGIEIYRDRPRSAWPRANGAPAMTTDPLDARGILAEADGAPVPPAWLEPATVLGHMHLHVAHLDEAIEFYRRVVGLELQMRYGAAAAFLSAGGYHHHIGLNTWNGVGAPPPPAHSIGMRYFTMRLANAEELGRLRERLEAAQVAYEVKGDGVLARDPSTNKVLFVAG